MFRVIRVIMRDDNKSNMLKGNNMRNKLVKSRIIALTLALLFCVNTTTVGASSKRDENLTDSSTEQTYETEMPANKLNKIHFYTGTSDHTYIDDADELGQAIANVQKTNKVSVQKASDTEQSEVKVTVQLVSNIAQTDEYQAFMLERKSIDSVESSRDFRGTLLYE